MMSKCVAFVLLLAVAGAAGQTLLEVVNSNKDLTLLADAIKQAKLEDALKNFTGTVFAPTDKAFQAAEKMAKELGVYDMVLGELPSILEYHLVPGKPKFSKDLPDGTRLKTALENMKLTIKYRAGKPFVKAVGNAAAITQVDIPIGTNVVVHLIDAVLLPIELPAAAPDMAPAPAPGPVESTQQTPAISTRAIYDNVIDAAKAEGLDNFVAAVEAADLAGALGPEFNGTIFAPTNQALEKFLEDANIDLATASKDVLEAVTRVLLYHVVPNAAVLSTQLTTGEMFETLEGAPIMADVSNGGVMIEDAAGKSYEVVNADIMAGDAVIHVIDGVLSPDAAAPAPTGVSSGASSVLAGFAALAGSALAAALLA